MSTLENKFLTACNLFNVKNIYVDYEKVFKNIDNFSNEVKENGFLIIKELIEDKLIDELKHKWIKILNQKVSFNTDLLYGQEVNYTKNFFNKYTRHFDFYWNSPTCKMSRDLSIQLHALRNLLTNLHPLYGLILNENKIGIYLAITNYKINSGQMNAHVDPNSFLPVHYNLPLSFKGEDYLDGGLNIKVNNKFVNIDNIINKGDLLLFNGSIPHSVNKVEGQGKISSIGRLQMFAVPDDFSKYKKQSFSKKIIFEFYGRFRYFLSNRNFYQNKSYKNFR